MKNYVAWAQKYVQQVLSGEVLACVYVRQACERQKKDLEKSKSGSFPYVFDPFLATRACFFIEHLRHVKGPKAGQLIQLEPWQCFVVTSIFGWVHKDTRKRRFKRSYIEVPRGNAKSTLSAAIGLYMMTMDGEGGADCYSFATTREQAREVFDTARDMVRRCTDVSRELGIKALDYSIVQLASNSKFVAKSAQGSTLDGLNTHFACIDELHAHKTREVYDVVETSIGKRLQPLLFAITTAGFNLSGICYELRNYVIEVLSGKSSGGDDQFGIIYTIDKEDDWTSDSALIKANPNWGVSVHPETTKSLRDKAQTVASAVNNFKTKHLDVWCNADAAWMDLTKWNECGDPALEESDFYGQESWLGLDLASKIDLTAAVRLFCKTINGVQHFFVFPQVWLPRETVNTAKNASYSGWEYEARLKVTEGAVVDFEEVKEYVRRSCSDFVVKEIAYDPWQATQLASELTEQGCPMVEVRNSVQNFSEPMKTIEALVMSGRLHHPDDPIFNWCVSNVVCHRDAKDNIYPNKLRNENKIDLVVALIMAFYSFLIGGGKIEKPVDLTPMLDSPLIFNW